MQSMMFLLECKIVYYRSIISAIICGRLERFLLLWPTERSIWSVVALDYLVCVNSLYAIG